jgi:glycosyltransferase involved in cell wall biosynthesis
MRFSTVKRLLNDGREHFWNGFNPVGEKLRESVPPALRFWLKFKREQLLAKWRKELRQDHSKQDGLPPARAVNNRPGLNVIVFDDRIPAPDWDAGSARMFLILKSLTKLSRPVFISMGQFQRPEYEQQLTKEGVEIAPWIDYQRLLKSRRFQVALLSRADVAGALLRSVKRAAPGIKTIFDTVDIAFLRLEREYQLTGSHKVAQAARRYKKLETRLARSCDQVWCVTAEDGAALAREAPSARLEIIPTIHPLQDRGKSFTARQGLVFIGNFLHRPNTDAIHYFMQEIYPLVREAIPAVTLFIVGDHALPELAAYASNEVTITGYVADVDPIFQSCRVFIAPLRFGSGIKGKIGQALSYGLPVVTTPIGAEGMSLENGSEAIIADGIREFASALISVYKDEALWQRLSDRGYRHIARYFTPQVVEEKIHQAIKSLCDLSETDQSTARTRG